MTADWTLRPLTEADIDDVARISGREERAYLGTVEGSAAQLRETLAGLDGFDPERDMVGAERSGVLVAAAIVMSQSAAVTVDPDHEGLGIGARLLRWTIDRQRELGRGRLLTNVMSENGAAAELLRSAGFAYERSYVRMRRLLADADPLVPPPLPAGFRVRPIDAAADRDRLHALDDRAFRDRPDYDPESLDQFGRLLLERSEFVSGYSFVAEDADGRPAGFVVGWRMPRDDSGFVALLAVDPSCRRRGLARGLLLQAFAAMQAAGHAVVELGVASDNPDADALYTSVGMTPGRRFDTYTRPG